MKNFIGIKRIGQNKKAMEKLLNKKSIATLKADLQKVFNQYIRIRDTRYDKGTPYFICISCNQPKGLEQMNAGHYHPVGGNEAVRFDEDNVHGQCIHCNHFQHSNEKQYRPNLIKKIGQKAFDALEIRRYNKSKMMAFEIELLISHYKEKISNECWKKVQLDK